MGEPRPGACGRWRRVVPLLACLVALTACSTGGSDTTPRALPSAFDDGVPALVGPVVLTVTTDDDVVDWDLTAIAMLEQQDLTIVEPFVDEEHTYTGPLWSDVLRASGVDLEAGRTVELVALDAYVAEIPADRETLTGVLLAHLEDGTPIPIADGGPIRLVYPPDNPAADNANNWIWSIRTAEVL